MRAAPNVTVLRTTSSRTARTDRKSLSTAIATASAIVAEAAARARMAPTFVPGKAARAATADNCRVPATK